MSKKKSKKRNNTYPIYQRNSSHNSHSSLHESREFLKIQQIQISSPVPPPDLMAKYEEILPGATDRILKLAEKQHDHREYLEKNVITNDTKRANWGLFIGSFISISLIVVACILLYNDKPISGFTLFTGAVLPRVISFFIARKDKNKQLEKNA